MLDTEKLQKEILSLCEGKITIDTINIESSFRYNHDENSMYSVFVHRKFGTAFLIHCHMKLENPHDELIKQLKEKLK